MRTKTTIENINRVKNAITTIRTLPSQFTSKEYNSNRTPRQSSSLDYLVTYGIVQVARTELIKVKVKNPKRMSGIFTEDGSKLMEEWEWDRLSTTAKGMISKMIGELYVGWEGETTIDAKRYYYTVNEENLKKYMDNRIPRVIHSVNRTLADLYKKVEIYENVSNLITALAS